SRCPAARTFSVSGRPGSGLRHRVHAIATLRPLGHEFLSVSLDDLCQFCPACETPAHNLTKESRVDAYQVSYCALISKTSNHQIDSFSLQMHSELNHDSFLR